MGTGTLSTLVLALLSFIAETKRDSVVFAMEEPEIAVPPHTQRRIVNYLLASADQCFVTSHSPYVIESFEPEQIRILRKEPGAALVGHELRVGDAIKLKTYRRHARRAFAEAILGRGVIVGEGITEKDIVLAAAAKLEQAAEANYPMDLSGVSVLSVDGEGGLAEFGEFFNDLGISAYALFDAKAIPQAQRERIEKAYKHACQTKYVGAETLLIAECPVKRLWELLVEVRESGAKPGLVPAGDVQPADDQVKILAKSLLTNDKGSGYAGRLVELCDVAELPVTVTNFLKIIYGEFQRPEAVPPYEPDAEETQAGDKPASEQLAQKL
jgi:putative ATP-dependent endonuclease of OLD family